MLLSEKQRDCKVIPGSLFRPLLPSNGNVTEDKEGDEEQGRGGGREDDCSSANVVVASSCLCRSLPLSIEDESEEEQRFIMSPAPVGGVAGSGCSASSSSSSLSCILAPVAAAGRAGLRYGNTFRFSGVKCIRADRREVDDDDERCGNRACPNDRNVA